ncbi:MAG: 3-oxoacyl-[acyl-carrier-protein] reductase [Chitinophagales bacterium]|nr:3-oxoacyl-[acyl-carrier-protein] reductase [Chitinophagales bacterium]
MGLLESKTALVTGGTRGIGKAIAEKFAKEGAKVAFTYLSSEEKAKAIESDLKKLGPDAMAIKSDAASYEEAERLIAGILEHWGQIDIVVNNAGITKDNLMLRMSEEQWDDVINTNLKSVFNVTKQVLKPMMKARQGSIINLTSIVGMKGQGGQANYSASKAGMIGFTKSIADELGSRGIRSNAIAPGFIQTDMTDALPDATKEKYLSQIPLNRFGQTEEVADVALFLASDLSSYVSGQTISVCGALNR